MVVNSIHYIYKILFLEPHIMFCHAVFCNGGITLKILKKTQMFVTDHNIVVIFELNAYKSAKNTTINDIFVKYSWEYRLLCI